VIERASHTYRTTDAYPQAYWARGVAYRWIRCAHCRKLIQVIAHRVMPHIDFGTERECEGSNRFYWHIFGTRTADEPTATLMHARAIAEMLSQ
jgi:hypothetical protein